MRSPKNRRFLIFYVLGIYLFQEIVFRALFPVPELSNFNRIRYQLPDRQIAKSMYLTNTNRTWESSLDTNYQFVHVLNEYGFRDESWPLNKAQDKKRLFIVGDSFVEGVMADQDQSIPAFFAQKAGKKYEVFNCGMVGVGMDSYLRFLTDAVPVFQPDEVLLVLFSNDVAMTEPQLPKEALSPQYNSFWKPRLLELVQRLVNKQAISMRWTRSTKPFLYPVPDNGNPFTDGSHLLEDHVTEQVKQAMQKATFSYFRVNWLQKEEENLQKDRSLGSSLQYIRDYLARYHTKLTVFYLPSRSQVTRKYYPYDRECCLNLCSDQMDLTSSPYQIHQKRLGEDCHELGIVFHDLTEKIRQAELNTNLYWNYDDHMKARGYHLVSEVLYKRWSER